jgi:hypothetical protein
MRKVLQAVIVEWKAINLLGLMCELGIDWQRLRKIIWEPHDKWHCLIIGTTKLHSGFYFLENKRSIPWTEACVVIRVSECGTNVLMYHTVFLKTTFFSTNLLFVKYQYPWFSVADTGCLFCLVPHFIKLFLLCLAANLERTLHTIVYTNSF